MAEMRVTTRVTIHQKGYTSEEVILSVNESGGVFVEIKDKDLFIDNLDPAHKQCPHCGGEPVEDFVKTPNKTENGNYGVKTSYTIKCGTCFASSISTESYEDAWKKWDQRV